ncbi:Rv2629 family ribosome hibernation factor [Allokutzneria albata]|uniref:Peptide chain release factor 1 (ERF1) n=1 Tax=Allokutzneria albata TaxID=211114 RepID=A0A1H0D1C7_ALLAB|nr:Vms1/Ankzf1 family peptidyl-tRNA hydrolase [Allokutzneria albata]SDN63899.1 hypothetical protein SAMN04489726_7532 [Allokutzneria albata]
MDLTQLRGLVAATGPFASVYLDDSHDTPDAPKALELRWREARATLAEQGADERTLSSVDRALAGGEPARGRAGRALIASGGEVLLDRHLPEPPAQPIARWSALPYLMPLLEQTEADLPHVAVLVDGAGGEVLGYDGDGRLVDRQEVAGQDHPLHDAGGGGMAHKRIRQRVENTKQDNAIAVAEAADRMVRRLGARLLVLSGEVQARTAVRAALPDRSAAIAEELTVGGHVPGADQDALGEAVHKLIKQQVDAIGHNAVDRFRIELGRQGDATQGLPAVATALREGRVDTVLLDGAATADRTIWIGSEPTQIAIDEAELRSLGVPHLARERADSALVMAAVATGARLQLATGEPELADGVGALLRG